MPYADSIRSHMPYAGGIRSHTTATSGMLILWSAYPLECVSSEVLIVWSAYPLECLSSVMLILWSAYPLEYLSTSVARNRTSSRHLYTSITLRVGTESAAQ